MKKLIVFISAMLLISSGLFAEGNLGFGGGVDFKVNLLESQQNAEDEDVYNSKGNTSQFFEGDDEDAYNIKLSYAGMFNDNKTFFLMALDTDGEDYSYDGLNNDDGFFLLINHKPNDFVEIQVTGAFRFNDDANAWSNNTDNMGILDEWADADGTYLKLKPSSMFHITFFPMNASTTIGSEFPSTATQGGMWNQTSDSPASASFYTGGNNTLYTTNDYNCKVAGIGIDLFPIEGLSINAVLNTKKLTKDVDSKDVDVDGDGKDAGEYNAFGYRLSAKYENKDLMGLNAAFELNGNTQEASDSATDIETKGINSYAVTQMAINARASFVPVENLNIATEFAMTTLNGAAINNLGYGTFYAPYNEAGTGRVETKDGKSKAKQYDGEAGIAFMLKVAYNLSSFIPMANQNTDVYGKFRMYGENFVWDDGEGADNISFVCADGSFNRMDFGANYIWNGVNINPEFTLRTADKKIFTDDDGKPDDTRTTFTLNVGYSF